jgi:cytochrome b561
MAVGFVAAFYLGFTMVLLPLSLTKMKTYALHKSIGMTLLLLGLIRLGWRRWGELTPTPLPAAPWANRLAQAVHGLLYVGMLSLPLTGWWYNSAAGYPVQVFGWFNVPHLGAADPLLKPIAHTAHLLSVWAMLALLGLHVLAALKHHFIDQDSTLRRMLGLSG